MNSQPTPLTDAEFQRLTDDIFLAIETQVDEWLQKDVIDIDAHRTGGMLELTLPNASKLVVNTQPPLQEIWLASSSGGYHFRYNERHWVDSKSGQDFFQTLSDGLSEQAQFPLRFRPNDAA